MMDDTPREVRSDDPGDTHAQAQRPAGDPVRSPQPDRRADMPAGTVLAEPEAPELEELAQTGAMERPGERNDATAEAEISASEPDWSREARVPGKWEPSRALLASIRDFQRAEGPFRTLRRKWAVLRHRFWSVVTGADIPVNSTIGGGLSIPHPNGIVIHPAAVIGPNCFVLQQVTIGWGRGGVPTLGGHVDVGAGAKIIGAIRIGDHARIGANAVVIRDVAPGSTVVGNPAREVARRG